MEPKARWTLGRSRDLRLDIYLVGGSQDLRRSILKVDRENKDPWNRQDLEQSFLLELETPTVGTGRKLNIHKMFRRRSGLQGRRERGVPAPHFQEQTFLFHVKSENINFLHANYMWEFIYWTRHKWQKVDSFSWICRFISKLSYHSYQKRVGKILFFKNLVKTNSNLICDSL